jgi:hypothetical protein
MRWEEGNLNKAARHRLVGFPLIAVVTVISACSTNVPG